MKTGQSGFALALVIIIIAAVGVGGGVYYSQKVKNKTAVENSNKSEQKADETVNTEVDSKSPVSVDTKTNTAISGTAKMNVTLQELLSYNKGKSVMCNGTSTTPEGAVITGTTYVNGETVRGDTVVVHKGTTTKSSMIMKGTELYAWTGNQGTKMTVNASFDLNTALSLKGSANQRVEYTCTPWTPDAAKFTVPASVQFTSLGSVTIPSKSGY